MTGKFRRVMILLLLAMMVLQVPVFSASAEQTKLEYWTAAWQTFYEAGKDAADNYMKLNPNVTIKVTPAARQEEILMSAVAAGMAPDIYGQFSSERESAYTQYKTLQPLDEMHGFDEVLNERVPERFQKDYTRKDGHIYIFPYNASPVMLVYNRTLFKEAGIVDENGEPIPPATWDEFKEVAMKLTKDTDGDGRIDQWGTWFGLGRRAAWRHLDYLPLYLSNSGGKPMYAEDGTPLFNSPEGIETLEFMLEIYENGWTPRIAEGYAAFPKGNIGMILAGGWLVGDLYNSDFDYGVAPIPAPAGKQYYTFLDAKDIGILAQSKNKQAAWEFVTYLVSKEQDLQMFKKTLQVPIRKGLDKDPGFLQAMKSIPYSGQFLEALPYSVNLPIDPDYMYFQQVFNNAYSRVLEGNVDVKEVLDDAADEINRFLSRR